MVCFDGMSKVVGSLDENGAMEMEKEDRKSQEVVIVVIVVVL